jgi:hypothetical protein
LRIEIRGMKYLKTVEWLFHILSKENVVIEMGGRGVRGAQVAGYKMVAPGTRTVELGP